jgi:hypothetical protein
MSPGSGDDPLRMKRRFYASHQMTGANRINKSLWFDSEAQAEQVCDELWTPDCRQEIVDTEARQFRVRRGDSSWSPWGLRHPKKVRSP